MKEEKRIETYKDDSMRKVWGAGNSDGMASKVDVYKWNKVGAQGKFMMLKKEILNLDLKYQREIDSRLRVAAIAKGFDWALFGVILVAFTGAQYFIIDGGHRWRGACRRDDVKELPCLVFDLKEISDAARIFYNYNNQRKTVTTFDNHKAALAGEGKFFESELAIKAEKLVTKYGYSFVKATSGKNGSYDQFKTASIKSIYKMIDSDENLADKCFSILAKTAEGGDIQQREISGLFYLMITNRGVDFMTFPLENMVKAGMTEIRETISRFVLYKGKGGEKVYAEALLEIVNRGQSKNKVFIP